MLFLDAIQSLVTLNYLSTVALTIGLISGLWYKYNYTVRAHVLTNDKRVIDIRYINVLFVSKSN